MKNGECRITQGKAQIDRLIRYGKKPFILIQTRTSYERYHLYKYIESHKLKFEKIEKPDEYMKYRVDDYSLDRLCVSEYIEKVRPGEKVSMWYYKRPIIYIKVYRK